MKTDNKSGKTKKQRKKAQRSSSSSSNSDIDEIKLIDTDDDMDQDDVDAEYFYCSNFFLKIWIRCVMCQRWFHEDCADVRNGKTFICLLAKPLQHGLLGLVASFSSFKGKESVKLVSEILISNVRLIHSFDTPGCGISVTELNNLGVNASR
ncbi:hypothetical protein FQR65_LT14300 [Abscondita terminalis]|nr:hypothetical protein FQR65_LT14300 [Abscondita terminalis]